MCVRHPSGRRPYLATPLRPSLLPPSTSLFAARRQSSLLRLVPFRGSPRHLVTSLLSHGRIPPLPGRVVALPRPLSLPGAKRLAGPIGRLGALGRAARFPTAWLALRPLRVTSLLPRGRVDHFPDGSPRRLVLPIPPPASRSALAADCCLPAGPASPSVAPLFSAALRYLPSRGQPHSFLDEALRHITLLTPPLAVGRLPTGRTST